MPTRPLPALRPLQYLIRHRHVHGRQRRRTSLLPNLTTATTHNFKPNPVSPPVDSFSPPLLHLSFNQDHNCYLSEQITASESITTIFSNRFSARTSLILVEAVELGNSCAVLDNLGERWILSCCATVLLLVACLAVGEWETCSGIVLVTERSNRISIADFGGVEDGQTFNTKAFMEAIYQIQNLMV
nr:probable polygalacturonase [Ipomoea batatas]